MITLRLSIWWITNCFPKHYFTFPPAVHEVSGCSTSSPAHPIICIFFIIVILMGITWYLLILIWIFLMDNVKCLFYAHWPLVYFLCINVYSNTLSIFNWVFAFYCWAVRVNLCVQIHFPIKYVICKYFVSVFSLLFHTFNRAFMKGQVFLIWWVYITFIMKY